MIAVCSKQRINHFVETATDSWCRILHYTKNVSTNCSWFIRIVSLSIGSMSKHRRRRNPLSKSQQQSEVNDNKFSFVNFHFLAIRMAEGSTAITQINHPRTKVTVGM